MKKSFLNVVLVFAIGVCHHFAFAQSAQPQNGNQNTTPSHYGTDPNNGNPSPQQGNPTSNPGNNTAPGTKPVNGEYGNPAPNGSTGPSGSLRSPRTNSGATGASGSHQPQRYNGSEHQRSPQ